MMTQAFYTGLSGLRSSSTGIDVVSDNLANVSTVGYRSYDVEFSSIFEETLNTSSLNSGQNSIGIGTYANAISMNETAGELIITEASTDLAISGEGWFGVQGTSGEMFTRAGNFTFNADSALVTPDGNYVLGTMANNIENGILTNVVDSLDLGDINTQEKLEFPNTLYSPADPTSIANFYGNLGISDETRKISASVIDSQSNKNELKLTFTKSEVQNELGTRWDVVAVTSSLDGESVYDTQEGVVEFDETGGLVSSSLKTIDNNGTEVEINLGTEMNGVISTDSMAISGSSSSDGTIGGELLGYTINMNSEVIATFSNGVQSSVGKVAVYHFQNDQGLERISGSLFQETSNSGEALFYQDENGKNILGSTVVHNKLENSNYNIAAGLTDLIILQRSFDANSKSITTAHEMMQKALQMDA